MATWYGVNTQSRLMLGTSRYPSPDLLCRAIEQSQTEIVTVSLRRQAPGQKGGQQFWDLIRSTRTQIASHRRLHLLPNTAGCRTVKEAVATAHLAREIFSTDWIKLEVIGCEDNLAPDPFALVESARILTQAGFSVFPYMTLDVVVAERLLEVGCQVLMPWGSPIGSGQGLVDPGGLRTLRNRFPNVPLIIDAGLGKPSHAMQAMELGADGVLINTAVALATYPVEMAEAFAQSVDAGRKAFLAGMMEPRDTAIPSTPTLGTPFWKSAPGSVR